MNLPHAEHDLPPAYVAYLDTLPHYQPTRLGQKMGAAFFLATWFPFLAAVMVSQRVSQPTCRSFPPLFDSSHLLDIRRQKDRPSPALAGNHHVHRIRHDVEELRHGMEEGLRQWGGI